MAIAAVEGCSVRRISPARGARFRRP